MEATVRRFAPAVLGYALPFLLVLYLAFEDGGHDAIVRGEVGIALWWIVLVGAAVGLLPAAAIPRFGWIGLALLAAFSVWTGLAAGWSESSERSIAELGRMVAYLGVLVLALGAQGRGDRTRRTVAGVGAAIAVVGIAALLSRLEPSWFPESNVVDFIGEAGRRLGYPLDYWNGLAALIAVGLPAVAWLATEARSTIARAAAAASLPALALAAYFTLSRGGALAIALALAVLVALYPRRSRLLPTLAIALVGSTVLVALGAARPDLADGLTTPTADSQGESLLFVVLAVCALAAAAQATLAPRLSVVLDRVRPPRGALVAGAGLVALAAVAALAVGGADRLGDAWEDFKDPAGPADVADRFESTSGNGRYQYWSAMVDAAESEPLTGIGAGTFEFWWAREGDRTGFVRDAHSLFFESLGELGVVGLVLIGAFFALVLLAGARLCLAAGPFPAARATETLGDPRAALAAATAGCVGFAFAAGIDWVWNLYAVTAAFLLLAGAILAARPAVTETAPVIPGPGIAVRVGMAVLALAALVAIGIPLSATSSIRASQERFRAGDLGSALEHARDAEDVQPYAATPKLQQALVLEQAGALEDAAVAARAATRAESTNWRTWQVLSRLEAERGEVDAALAAYRRARALNPRSRQFAR